MMLEDSKRSTLILNSDGTLVRRYKDTGHEVPRLPSLDEAGVRRGPHNRKLPAENTFRNAEASPPAAFLQRTRAIMKSSRPESIDALADFLLVQTSTAWCYLCQCVEHWPELSSDALVFTHPPLRDAFLSLQDTSGKLTEVMERLNTGPLEGDVEWRCMDDRYAQVRLVRLMHT